MARLPSSAFSPRTQMRRRVRYVRAGVRGRRPWPVGGRGRPKWGCDTACAGQGPGRRPSSYAHASGTASGHHRGHLQRAHAALKRIVLLVLALALTLFPGSRAPPRSGFEDAAARTGVLGRCACSRGCALAPRRPGLQIARRAVRPPDSHVGPGALTLNGEASGMHVSGTRCQSASRGRCASTAWDAR